FSILLMSHFGSASIRPLCNHGNSQGLMAMIAGNFHRIFIGVLDFLLFDPKEHSTFRTFLHKHGHNFSSRVTDTLDCVNILHRTKAGNY
ncbi:MAG: hypothetical protein R3351_04095, partial [Nitrospirales bacterium]|nr:hypothetical protein [Nitrospirales bacterium]